MNVLPGEQEKVLAEDVLDVLFAEGFSNGPAMLVINDTRRLVEHLPAALPGQITQVRVFQIERLEQFVEAAELEKLPAVEGARSAAAIEARIQFANRGFLAMAYFQGALQPPAFRQA